MKCQACGGRMSETRSDMPFKLDHTRIVIIRELPIWQCGECQDYAFADAVMMKIETALAKADKSIELEVVRYAA